MTSPNPYAPPRATVADANADHRSLLHYVVASLIALQFLATLNYSGTYLELVRTGAVHPLALLFGFPASICLYIGAAFLLFKRSRGKLLFLFAAAGLALSVRYWGWPFVWSAVACLGSALGVAGWWVARTTPLEKGRGMG